mgnify:FL=1
MNKLVKSMNIPESFLDIQDKEVASVNMPDEGDEDEDEG